MAINIDACMANFPAWHRTPDAQRILASLITNPPRSKPNIGFDPRNRGMRETVRYTGLRVAKLHSLRDSAYDAIVAAHDMDALGAHLDTPQVDVLVYTAILGRNAALGIFGLAADDADLPAIECET